MLAFECQIFIDGYVWDLNISIFPSCIDIILSVCHITVRLKGMVWF